MYRFKYRKSVFGNILHKFLINFRELLSLFEIFNILSFLIIQHILELHRIHLVIGLARRLVIIIIMIMVIMMINPIDMVMVGIDLPDVALLIDMALAVTSVEGQDLKLYLVLELLVLGKIVYELKFLLADDGDLVFKDGEFAGIVLGGKGGADVAVGFVALLDEVLGKHADSVAVFAFGGFKALGTVSDGLAGVVVVA